jgi:hypothetical protein
MHGSRSPRTRSRASARNPIRTGVKPSDSPLAAQATLKRERRTRDRSKSSGPRPEDTPTARRYLPSERCHRLQPNGGVVFDA